MNPAGATELDRAGSIQQSRFPSVFAQAVAALDAASIPYVLLGGLASAVLGRPRCTQDIDLFVKPEDALRTLAALRHAGFLTQETNPHWIYKAFREGVTVDVLFKARGDIYLDDVMLARSRVRSCLDQPVRVIPPEDLIVIKALVHDEETPRHWHDALGIIAAGRLDWGYLVRRANKGPHRVLSLLLYAVSLGLVVPPTAVRALYTEAFDAQGTIDPRST
jgi:predicted nucleotidyltransferase